MDWGEASIGKGGYQEIPEREVQTVNRQESSNVASSRQDVGIRRWGPDLEGGVCPTWQPRAPAGRGKKSPPERREGTRFHFWEKLEKPPGEKKKEKE